MEVTENIRIFAENLNNLRAVNLYVSLADGVIVDIHNLPVLSVKDNVIEIQKLGNFKVILDELSLQDCPHLTPRTIDKNIMCYRLIVQPPAGSGSAAAEIISHVERIIDDGAKNLVRNSINNVALKEGTSYRIKCRFCLNFLSNIVKFDRIRPLPSKNWVEYAHELWYCHHSEPSQAEGLNQDVSARLNQINLAEGASSRNKSIVELLKSPDINYCFYGPCNWAVNMNIVHGISKNDQVDNCLVCMAECSNCKNELGSFTSENCVKFWDYAVEWMENPTVLVDSSPTSSIPPVVEPNPNLELISNRAELNFKSIVFGTIYELSDHPTFRFTVSSTSKGNSVFLWNIDRNLSVYQQKAIPAKSTETVAFDRCKVAKFFYAVKKNNVLSISDPREIQIIQESEQNEQSILTVPDPVFQAGIRCLERSSVMYSRDRQTLQCGYLVYDV